VKRHAEIQKLLAVYSGLDATERSAVDAHTRTCRACADRRAAYAEMDARLAALVDPAPPASLSKSLAHILHGEQSKARGRAATGDRRWSSRRVLVPAGLLLLLILSVWLIMRASTPVDHEIAQTPSVTPTSTPIALASPQEHHEIVSLELLSWLATRYPASPESGTAGYATAASPDERDSFPSTPAAFRPATLPVLSTVVAHR